MWRGRLLRWLDLGRHFPFPRSRFSRSSRGACCSVKALLAQICSDLRWCGVVVSVLDPSPWRLGVGGAFYFIQPGLRWRFHPSRRAWVLLLPAVSFEALRRRVWSLWIGGAWSCLRFGVDSLVLCSGLVFHNMALFSGFFSSRCARLGESVWVLFFIVCSLVSYRLVTISS